jgi:hypothetical protein
VPILVNSVLICFLVGVLIRTKRDASVPVHRRASAILLLGLVEIPLGVWQAALYLSAKRHVFAQLHDTSLVQFLREHLPLTVSQLAVEILVVMLACLIGWLLRSGSDDLGSDG